MGKIVQLRVVLAGCKFTHEVVGVNVQEFVHLLIKLLALLLAKPNECIVRRPPVSYYARASVPPYVVV